MRAPNYNDTYHYQHATGLALQGSADPLWALYWAQPVVLSNDAHPILPCISAGKVPAAVLLARNLCPIRALEILR